MYDVDKQNELPETGEKVRNGTLFGTLFAGLGSLLLPNVVEKMIKINI